MLDHCKVAIIDRRGRSKREGGPGGGGKSTDSRDPFDSARHVEVCIWTCVDYCIRDYLKRKRMLDHCKVAYKAYNR